MEQLQGQFYKYRRRTNDPCRERTWPAGSHGVMPPSPSILNLIRGGESRLPLALYQRIHHNCGYVGSRTCVALLKVCGHLKDLNTGCRLHHHVFFKDFMKDNAFVTSALIHMYATCGSLDKAREIFDKLSTRNVVTWNALIGGYAHHEYSEESLYFYEEMKLQRVLPDVVTFACALKACGSIANLETGIEIHVEISRRALLRRNIFLGSALVDMYAKCGMLVKAQEVFNTLEVRNVVTWTSLISGYAQYDHGEKALGCFEQMRSDGISPNLVTYACSLKACGGIGAIEMGIRIHSEISNKGLLKADVGIGNTLIIMYTKFGMLSRAQAVFDSLPNRNLITWTSLIAGYVQHGYGRAALKCFEKMQANGIYPDAITYACSLKACGSIGAIDKGRKIHSEIDRNGLLSKQNLTIGCALINMYSKCGFLEKAQQVFDTLPIHNSFTWNALISGYAQCGEFEDIISYFDMMIQKGHKPDPITFLSILNSCSHAGLIEKGQTYYHVMAQVYGIIPNILHYACFIDVLGRAGQLDKVEAMILRIPFCPNTGLWLSMLGSCKKWCNADLGRYAFKHVVEIE